MLAQQQERVQTIGGGWQNEPDAGFVARADRTGRVGIALAQRTGGIRCVGQDSNLGTPSGRDLESLAFDRAWLPTRGPRRDPSP